MPLDNSDLINKFIKRWINSYNEHGTLESDRSHKLFIKLYPELEEKIEERFNQYNVTHNANLHVFKEHSTDKLPSNNISLHRLKEHLKQKGDLLNVARLSNYGLGFVICKKAIPSVDFDTVVFVPSNIDINKENDISLIIPHNVQTNITREKNTSTTFLDKLVLKIKESRKMPDSIMIYPIIQNPTKLKEDEQMKTDEGGYPVDSSELAKKTSTVVDFLRNELKSQGITTNKKVNIDILNANDIFNDNKQHLEI